MSEDTTKRRYWSKSRFKRDELNEKPVYFHVTIGEHPAQGIGRLRFRSRNDSDLVCIELRFNVPPPDGDYRSSWHETHGLPQDAVDSLEVSDHPDYAFILDYRHNIRKLPDQGLEQSPSRDLGSCGDLRA